MPLTDARIYEIADKHGHRFRTADEEGMTFDKHALLDFANEVRQAATPKPLDDPRLQELFSNAIDGALTLGYQNSSPPPDGHWLARFWNIGRQAATPAPAEPNAERYRRVLGHLLTWLAHNLPFDVWTRAKHSEPWKAGEAVLREGLTPLNITKDQPQ